MRTFTQFDNKCRSSAVEFQELSISIPQRNYVGPSIFLQWDLQCLQCLSNYHVLTSNIYLYGKYVVTFVVKAWLERSAVDDQLMTCNPWLPAKYAVVYHDTGTTNLKRDIDIVNLQHDCSAFAASGNWSENSHCKAKKEHQKLAYSYFDWHGREHSPTWYIVVVAVND